MIYPNPAQNQESNPQEQSTNPPPPNGSPFATNLGQQPYGQQPYSHPNPPMGTQPNQYLYIAPKSKIAAGLLGIFLGAFGAHNFYLGFSGKGVGQLLITLLSLGMLAWVSSIWGAIEGILYLASDQPQWSVDASGIPLVK